MASPGGDVPLRERDLSPSPEAPPAALIRRMSFDLTGKRVWVAGHRGLVGGALVRRLSTEDCVVLTAPRSEVDVADLTAVSAYLKRERPDAVIVAAASMRSLSKNTPFDGWTLRGGVAATIVGGRAVYVNEGVAVRLA